MRHCSPCLSRYKGRLREYLLKAKQVMMQEAQQELMLMLSPKLQGELSLQVNGNAHHRTSTTPIGTAWSVWACIQR